MCLKGKYFYYNMSEEKLLVLGREKIIFDFHVNFGVRIIIGNIKEEDYKVKTWKNYDWCT